MPLPREERSVALPIAPVGDVSRGLREAGASVARQGEGMQQALRPIAETLLGEGRKMAEEQGRDEAATVPLERDAEGRLAPPSLDRSPFTTAGQESFRAALNNRYANEFQLENRRDILRLRTENQNDPEAFLAAAQSHRDGLMSTLPPVLRGPVSEAFGREVGQHYSSLWEQRAQRVRQEGQAVATEAVNTLGTDLNDRIRAGDTAGAARVQQEIEARLAAATAAGTLPPTGAAALRRTWTVVQPEISRVYAETTTARAAGVMPAFQDVETAVRTVAPAARMTSTHRSDNPNSQHAHGRAIDFDLKGVPEEQRVALVRQIVSGQGIFAGAAGLGTYNATGDSLHVDFRDGDRTAWGPDRRRGSLPQTPQWFQEAVQGWVGPRPAAAPGQAPRPTGDNLMVAAEAVVAGPSHPGWQARWGNLTTAEREDMATTFRARARGDRAEETYQTERRNTALNLEAARLTLRAATPDLPPGERGAIQTRLIEISNVTGSPAAVAFLRQEASDARVAAGDRRLAANETEQQEGYQVTIRDALDRIRTARPSSSPGMEGSEPMPSAIGAAIRETQAYSPRVQAMELQRIAGQEEAHARALQTVRVPLAEVNNALQTGSRVTGTPAHQEIARNLLPDGAADLATPGNQQALMQFARSGILLSEVDAQMTGALQARDMDRVTNFARLHRAMMEDPATRADYMGKVPAQLRDAYAIIAQGLPSLPNDERRLARFTSLADEANQALRMTPEVMEERRSRFGATEQEQNRNLDQRLTAALSDVGMLGLGTLPTNPPEEMREQFRSIFLRNMRQIPDEQANARVTLQELQRQFQPTVVGLPMSPRAEDTRNPGFFQRSGDQVLAALRDYTPHGWAVQGLNNLFRGGETPSNLRTVTDRSPVVARVWTRDAPESHLAISGDRTEPSAHWLVEDFRGFAQRLGVPPEEAQAMRMGENARWQVTDRMHNGERLYQLMRSVGSSGAWEVVPFRMQDGTPLGVTLGYPLAGVSLAAEARRLNSLRTPEERLNMAISREERERRARPGAVRDALVPPDPMSGGFRP